VVLGWAHFHIIGVPRSPLNDQMEQCG
jgi:hypothetical protein